MSEIFYLCLNENIMAWPDVAAIFSFSITHSSKCVSCGYVANTMQTTQMIIEMEVPPDGTDLKMQVENYLNEGETQPYFCEEGCRQRSQQIRRMAISSVDELEFLTVILTRALDTQDGYQFVRNRITATSDINIRYFLYQ